MLTDCLPSRQRSRRGLRVGLPPGVLLVLLVGGCDVAQLEALPDGARASDLAPALDAAPVADRALPADDGGAAGEVTCAKVAGDFYRFDVAQLPAESGRVIRCEPLTGTVPAGYLGYRVMYRTSTLLHQAGQVVEFGLPATGQVYIPAAPPAGPRPVLANTHGTVGIVAKCAPSRSESATLDRDVLFDKLKDAAPDAVIVVPDFVGLGVDHGGRSPDVGVTLGNGARPFSNVSHPFLSLEGEARATIDLVRAATTIRGAGTGDQPKWLAVGPSQGGHAAIAVAEVSHRGYGVGPRLVGVIAGAPTSEFENRDFSIPEISRAVIPMMLVGLSLEWRDLKPSLLLTSGAQSAFATTANAGCLDLGSWVVTYSGVGSVLAPGADARPEVVAALRANSPGYQATDVPIFLGQVTGDPVVVVGRTRLLVARMRDGLDGNPPSNPGKLTYCEYQGTDSAVPWIGRLNDHQQVLVRMFASGSGNCTDPRGVAISTNAAAFAKALFAQP